MNESSFDTPRRDDHHSQADEFAELFWQYVDRLNAGENLDAEKILWEQPELGSDLLGELRTMRSPVTLELLARVVAPPSPPPPNKLHRSDLVLVSYRPNAIRLFILFDSRSRLALAYQLDRLIEAGEIRSYAEAARIFAVSRARIAQIHHSRMVPASARTLAIVLAAGTRTPRPSPRARSVGGGCSRRGCRGGRHPSHESHRVQAGRHQAVGVLIAKVDRADGVELLLNKIPQFELAAAYDFGYAALCPIGRETEDIIYVLRKR